MEKATPTRSRTWHGTWTKTWEISGQGPANCGGKRTIAAGSPDRPPDRQKFFAPQPAHGFAIVSFQVVERGGDRLPGRGDGGLGIAVGAADRLGHDAVDDAEAREILGG